MKLGMVTYNLGCDWDLDTLIANCEEVGFAGVELRTTHAHRVEVALSSAERVEVKKRFAGSAVELVGLGSPAQQQTNGVAFGACGGLVERRALIPG